MIYEVYKKFEADPGEMKIGDLVETSGWTNEAALVKAGYIGPTRRPESELKEAKVLPDGRVVFARNFKAKEVERPAISAPQAQQVPKKRGRPRKTKVPPKNQEGN